MELLIYTNNDFFFTFVSHIFSQDIKIVQIRDCNTFRSIITEERKNIFILVDSSQIQDDLCWTRMMTETTVPIMVINPDEKNTLKKLILLEQSITGILGNMLHDNDGPLAYSKVSDNYVLNDHTIFDVGNHCIYKNGTTYMLSTLEFKLLYYLAENFGKPVPVNDLIDYLDTSESVLYIYIKKIRSKIEMNPRKPTVLLNVRGKGYILQPTA